MAFNDEVNTPNLGANNQVTANFVSQFEVGFPDGVRAARKRARATSAFPISRAGWCRRW